MFTAVDYDSKDRESVAICLYGSMDNFPEYVQSAGPASYGGPLAEGWVSSAAPAVFNFIKSHGKQFDDPYSEHMDMTVAALSLPMASDWSESLQQGGTLRTEPTSPGSVLSPMVMLQKLGGSLRFTWMWTCSRLAMAVSTASAGSWLVLPCGFAHLIRAR